MRTLVALLVTVAALTACEKKNKTAAKEPTTPPAVTAGPTPTPTPAPATADAIKIGLQAPKVGETKTERETQNTAIKLKVPNQEVEITGVERKVVTEEVVAMDGDVVTKIKVTFAEFSKEEKMAGQPRPSKADLAGKSYLVTREGKTLKVTTVDGKEVPAAEAREASSGVKSVGRKAALDRLVAARSWKVGERYAFSAAELEEINDPATHADDEPWMDEMALTLTGSDGKYATFATEMKVRQGPAGGEAMIVAMKGTVVIEMATGRAQTLEMAGDVSGKMGGGDLSGTITGKTEYSYGG